MRHIGRVHRVIVQWLHECIGKHPDRDDVILCYDDKHNMSADIYAKAFASKENWGRALKLIHVFRKGEDSSKSLSEWVNERAFYDRSEESKRQKEPTISKAGHAREVKRGKAEQLQATQQKHIVDNTIMVSKQSQNLMRRSFTSTCVVDKHVCACAMIVSDCESIGGSAALVASSRHHSPATSASALFSSPPSTCEMAPRTQNPAGSAASGKGRGGRNTQPKDKGGSRPQQERGNEAEAVVAKAEAVPLFNHSQWAPKIVLAEDLVPDQPAAGPIGVETIHLPTSSVKPWEPAKDTSAAPDDEESGLVALEPIETSNPTHLNIVDPRSTTTIKHNDHSFVFHSVTDNGPIIKGSCDRFCFQVQGLITTHLQLRKGAKLEMAELALARAFHSTMMRITAKHVKWNMGEPAVRHEQRQEEFIEMRFLQIIRDVDSFHQMPRQQCAITDWPGVMIVPLTEYYSVGGWRASVEDTIPEECFVGVDDRTVNCYYLTLSALGQIAKNAPGFTWLDTNTREFKHFITNMNACSFRGRAEYGGGSKTMSIHPCVQIGHPCSGITCSYKLVDKPGVGFCLRPPAGLYLTDVGDGRSN